MKLQPVVGALAVLALGLFVLAPVRAGVEEYNSGVDGHGYALSFGDNVAVAAIKPAYFNFSDPGISGWDNEVTISLWLKFLDTEGTKAVGFAHDGDFNFYEPFRENAFLFGSANAWPPPNTQFQEWHHYTTTYAYNTSTSQGINKWYLDGVEVHSALKTQATFRLETLRMTVASLYSYHTEQNRVQPMFSPWNIIDDLGVFSRALTAAEVLHLYNNPVVTATIASDYPELMMYYTFDVDCTDPTGLDTNGLLDASCYMTSIHEARNYGSAGEKYNLLLGSLNNDLGFGKMWIPQGETNACVDPTPFDMPKPVMSTLPHASNMARQAPRVYRVDMNSSVTISFEISKIVDNSISPASDIVINKVPSEGTLLTAAGGSPINALDNPPASLTALYTAPSAMTKPARIVFTFNSVTYEIHIWGNTPMAVPTNIRIRLKEDAEVTVKLLETATDVSGEPMEVVITQLPDKGMIKYTEAALLGHPTTGRVFANSSMVVPGGGGPIDFFPDLNGAGDPYTTLKYKVRRKDGSSLYESNEGTITFVVEPSDDIAQGTPASAVTDEDHTGILVELLASDSEGEATDIFITTLPTKGKIYLTSDGTLQGDRELISQPYSDFAFGHVERQYASAVTKVSSFWGGGLYFGYHPMMVLGRPTCNTYTECYDERYPDAANIRPIVSDLLKVNVFVEDTSATPLYLPGVVKAVHKMKDAHGEVIDYRYDVWINPVQKLNSATQKWETCLMIGADYPASCSVAAAAARADGGKLYFRNITNAAFSTIDPGVWSPLFASYREAEMIGTSAGVYGDQYIFNTTHSDTYPSAFPPYTAYIEVMFDTPVFPVSLEVGSSRGAGGIVAARAKDPLGGWKTLYSGSPLQDESKLTAVNKLYHNFEPRICWPSFKTNHIRLEIDTTLETGIVDWNYIDYIALFGSEDAQKAMLRFPINKVVYVPDADAFGEDEFEFQVSDCRGNRFRNSPKTKVTVNIAGHPDPPKLELRDHQGKLIENLFVQVVPGIPTIITVVGRDVDNHQLQVALTSLPKHVAIKVASDTGANATTTIESTGVLSASSDGLAATTLTLEALTCTSPHVHHNTIGFQLTDLSNNVVKVSVKVDLNCGALPVKYKWKRIGDDSMNLASLLVGSGVVLCFLFAGFNIIHRKKSVIRFTSPKLNLILIMGCSLTYISLAFFGTIGPELSSCSSLLPTGLSTMDANIDLVCAEDGNLCCTEGAMKTCVPRIWIFTLGLTVLFTTLFSKTSRVVKIFASMTPKKVSISDEKVMRNVFMQTMIVVVILVIWTGAWPPTITFDSLPNELDVGNQVILRKVNQSCTGEHFDIMLVMLFAWFGLLLGNGIVLAYKVKGLHITQANDSPQIVLTTYNVFIFSVINVAISFIVSDPNNRFLFQVVCIWVALSLTLCALFVPRVLDVVNGRQVTVTNRSATSRGDHAASTTMESSGVESNFGRTTVTQVSPMPAGDVME